LFVKTFSPIDYTYKPKKIRKASQKDLQASIRIGKPIIGKNHPDYIACMVVNELLGGYFGSRLMQNIREDKGYTYGIHSSIVTLKNDAYFVIGTDVKREYVEATVQEIYHETQRLIDEPVAELELNTVRNYIKGSFLSSITTPFSIAEKVKNVRFYDLDYSFYHNFFDSLDGLDAEDILKAAQKYFSPEDMTEVIVG
jgi:predicted Zn-dependent peptidase